MNKTDVEIRHKNTQEMALEEATTKTKSCLEKHQSLSVTNFEKYLLLFYPFIHVKETLTSHVLFL